MSPREVGREIAAAGLRRLDTINDAIHVAWKTAYYTRRARSKRGLPKLKDELLKDTVATGRKGKRQTKQETATMIRMLAAQYGGRIQRLEA
jgi:hypothetical protein